MSALGVESPLETTGEPVRSGRRRSAHNRSSRWTPYLLIAPALIAIVALLGYPLYKMVDISFLKYGRLQLFGTVAPKNIGFKQYTDLFGDSAFWTVVWRTIELCAYCVIISVGAGLLLALLMNRVSNWVRLTMTIVMLLVWATPQLVSTQIWAWFFNAQFGVLNWLLSQIPGVHMMGHDWFADPNQGLYVVTASLIIWGAIPFLAITLHAGMTMVPQELVEAAKLDGASRIQVFRSVILPVIKPLLVIVTTLSIIWDFGPFNQIFVLRQNHPEDSYQVLSIFMYQKSFGAGQYGVGAASAVITVLLMLGVMVFYVRQMFKIGDVD
jgi:N,N'-diacetylchitobiose transport system permease protein